MDCHVESCVSGRQSTLWILLGKSGLIDRLARVFLTRSDRSALRKTVPVKSMWIATVAAFLLCAPLYPQGNAGQILGVVTGPTGAPPWLTSP